jgi:hypothetical protein
VSSGKDRHLARLAAKRRADENLAESQASVASLSLEPAAVSAEAAADLREFVAGRRRSLGQGITIAELGASGLTFAELEASGLTFAEIESGARRP